MRLAAQLYTVRDFCKDEKAIYQTLSKIKEMGYNSVQVSGFGEFRPQWLKNTITELGLKICATHTPYNRIINDTENVIKEHILYGANYVGLGMHDVNSMDKCKAFLNEILPAAEKIYDNGLKFVYHNHAAEFVKIDKGLTAMDYIADNTEKEKFGFLADFYWLQFAGISPLCYIDKYKERLDVVHLKDMKVIDNKTVTYAEIFEGNMDYKSILKKCIETGVKYAAVEQDVCDNNPFESLKRSFDNIMKRNLVDKENN